MGKEGEKPNVFGMEVRGVSVVQRGVQRDARGRCEAPVNGSLCKEWCLRSEKNGCFALKRMVSHDLLVPIALVRPQ